jgi:ribosomal protein S18 acetylase RimI-like enzyme
MPKFEIYKITDKNRPWVKKFIKGHWGSSLVIVHGHQFIPHEMNGFIANNEKDEKVGLISYDIRSGDCQIVTINSENENKGIGTALLNAVKNIAIDHFCKRMWLITTNDNIEALQFYQKYGFVICDVRINEIARSREIKPEIPLIGMHNIPIRDEIELEYKFKADNNQ